MSNEVKPRRADAHRPRRPAGLLAALRPRAGRSTRAAGRPVRLVTSSFAYGEAPDPDGYTREEFFYRHAFGPAGSRVRALSKRAEHPLDMLRYRRTAAAADVVHFEWLTVPRLDLRLLPRRPTVLTIHDPLERGRDRRCRLRPSRRWTRSSSTPSTRSSPSSPSTAWTPERVHVIHHGALTPTPGDFRPPRAETPPASRPSCATPASPWC